MLIIVDGIDGSGKGAIVDALRTTLAAQGKRVFDARTAMRDLGRVPDLADIGSADVVVTTEPTFAWIGAGLREALVRDAAYDPLTVAQAFAADREIHYRRLVLPALAAGKLVLSERGISGSLAYQVTAGVPEEALLALPGNRLALEHRPDLLVIATVDWKPALERLAARTSKDDGSYFEEGSFLERLVERFASPGFRRIFTERGTTIVDLSTEGSLEDTRRRVEQELLPRIQ